LHYTEEEIWQLTPRKFKSQLDVHEDIQRKMNGASKKNKKQTAPAQAGYIDQLSGW